jgi:hypothetical protein
MGASVAALALARAIRALSASFRARWPNGDRLASWKCVIAPLIAPNVTANHAVVLVRRLGSRPKGAGYIAAAPARLRRIVSIGAPMSSSSEFSWTATSWQSHADLQLRLRSSVHA